MPPPVAAADLQHTLAQPAVCAGVGLHSGAAVRMRMLPAPEGAGITFVRTDIAAADNRIPAHALNVSTTLLGTNLSNGQGVSVATVEHFLAACWGAGLDNALVELDGPELPIGDGSSAPFLAMIDAAGLRPQSAPRRRLVVLKPVQVSQGDKLAELAPGAGFHIDAVIDFPTPAIGRQTLALTLTPETFRAELAWARTFGFSRDIDQLRERGLARGGSLENAIVIGDDGAILNPEPVPADVFIRHKIIDVVGDLYLAGMPVEGRYHALQPGHLLNNQLLRRLLSDPEAYRIS